MYVDVKAKLVFASFWTHDFYNWQTIWQFFCKSQGLTIQNACLMNIAGVEVHERKGPWFFFLHKKEAGGNKELWPIRYYIVASETMFLLLWGIFHQQAEQKDIKEQGENDSLPEFINSWYMYDL